jgi:hypothetical protein
MLLVCGGLSKAANPDKMGSFTCFPPVLAILREEEELMLPAIFANIHEPFVVRLSDKDLRKIVASDVGKNALKRE